MANRLIHETSPYLLQHAHNPVDWYPWGDEAFARARAEDKPILLSIGYSACHWCHVMEHESFEDATTAGLMNDHFVNIKVDREERPDLDQIYMTAVQGMTGQGGWPMTVFLTPERKPFYGGTYFPPTDRGGLPGFRRVLASVAEGFAGQRSDIDLTASRVTEFIRQQTLAAAPSAGLDGAVLDAAFESLAAQFDTTNGGFGRAPKFPQAMALEFLLRYHHRTGSERAREIVDTTLQKMACGGIYDQIGGGFHRYSVDGRWLVPHFEKMLYDNALLARTYLHAYQVTRSPLYRRIVEETLNYVRREMVHEEGGFFSTQDADSDGVEGSYYVWTPDEIRAIVGHADAPLVLDFFGVTETGNFEGKTILTGPAQGANLTARHGRTAPEIADAMTRAQERLLAARCTRVAPARDDKVLSAWNGLMLRTFAEAASALGRPEDKATAAANAEFLSSEMWRDGQLFRVHKDGTTKIAGYLDDYAGVADGLLALYESIHDLRLYTTARDIVEAMVERFWDDASGTFFDTARDAEPLVARPELLASVRAVQMKQAAR